ncbi:MAG: carbohydrate ABC transporter permease [Limnochordia bacterium]
MWFKLQRRIAPYVFVLPGVVFYLMVTFIPAVIGIALSFTNWSIITPNFRWLGLRNYERLLGDQVFITSLKNTFRYALWLIPGVVILSFLLAILLNAKVKGMVVFRTIYYLPMVTPIAVASVIWMWIYDRRAGVLNYLTGLVGLPPRNWLNEPRTALGAIAVMGIWLAVGGNVVIYLAALKGISQSYYEAAEIDGAGYWQKIRYITLPLLRPTTLFVVITTTMGALRAFAQMNIMTQGGPLRSTTTIVFYIFQTAFTDLRMGYAAAMSIVLFLITLVLTFINWKFLGKGVSYDAD